MGLNLHKLNAHKPKGKGKSKPEYASAKLQAKLEMAAQAKRDRKKNKRVKDREDYERALLDQNTYMPDERRVGIPSNDILSNFKPLGFEIDNKPLR